MTEHERARQWLAAERADALARLNGLERELAGIIESSGAAGADEIAAATEASIAHFAPDV